MINNKTFKHQRKWEYLKGKNAWDWNYYLKVKMRIPLNHPKRDLKHFTNEDLRKKWINKKIPNGGFYKKIGGIYDW